MAVHRGSADRTGPDPLIWPRRHITKSTARLRTPGCYRDPPDAIKLGTVGKPVPYGEVTVSPEGEILIRGDFVFMGYCINRTAS